MKIVHVVLGKVNTNKMNGVNKVVDNLAKSQVGLGHQVTIWGITKNPIHSYPERNYATILFYDQSKFLLAKGVEQQIKKTEKGTVFHFHGGFIPQFYFVSKMLKKYGFKYVFTSHGSYNTVAMERSYWKKRLFIKLFDQSLVGHAKSLHFIGESEIEGAQKTFGFDNYALIPNGQSFEGVMKTSNSLSNKFPVIGFCGRLDIKTKGLDLLFHGFSQYVNESKNNQIELWLIGDGPERKDLETLARKLGVQNQVRFWGSVFGEDKIELIKKLDFMMLTSRNEGLPGVVLEAAALGVPSIVSRETNMSKYLLKYNAGIALEDNTPAHIQEAIQTAINTRLSSRNKEFRSAAKSMIAEEFDWSLIAGKVVKMYV